MMITKHVNVNSVLPVYTNRIYSAEEEVNVILLLPKNTNMSTVNYRLERF